MNKTWKRIFIGIGVAVSSLATMYFKGVQEKADAKEKHDKLVKESAEEAAKLVMGQLSSND